MSLAAGLGYAVEERDISVDELYSWSGEAALAGTAAVLAGVGTLVSSDGDHVVGDGGLGPNTTRLREALVAVQRGDAPDPHGWLTQVT